MNSATQVNIRDTQDNTQDNIATAQDSTQDENENAQDGMANIEERILVYCEKPRSVMEIAGNLEYRQRKSVKKILRTIGLGGKNCNDASR